MKKEKKLTRVKRIKKAKNRKQISSTLMCGIVLSGFVVPTAAVVLANTMDNASSTTTQSTSTSTVASSTALDSTPATPKTSSSVDTTSSAAPVSEAPKAAQGTPAAQGTVIVQYVDQDKKVISQQTLTAPVGDQVRVQAPYNLGKLVLDLSDPGQVVSGNSSVGPVQLTDGTGYWTDTAKSAPIVVQFNYVRVPASVNLNFVDTSDNKVLQVDTLKGSVGFPDITFGYNFQDRLAAYASQGYEFVNTDFDINDPFKVAGVATNTVNLRHKIVSTPEATNATRTIFYQDEKGFPIAKDYFKQLDFSRSHDEDLVTGTSIDTPWTPANQKFDAVTSPTIKGYTPDVKVVPEVTISDPSELYTPYYYITYAANIEHAKVNVVDGTSGTILKSKDFSGKFDTKQSVDVAALVKEFTDKGYQLDTDDLTNGSVVFDFDGSTRTYTVTLGHKLEKDVTSQTTKRTISFEIPGQAPFSKVQYATWETGTIKDLVTGKVTKVSEKLTAGNDHFVSVAIEQMTGYTTNINSIAELIVKPGDENTKLNVKYTPNAESATVNFVDKDGSIVKTITINGYFNDKVDVPKDVLEELTKAFYTYKEEDTQFKLDQDGSPKVVNVQLDHKTSSKSDYKIITRQIEVKDKATGKVIGTKNQEVKFTHTVITDLVLDKVTEEIDFAPELTIAPYTAKVSGYHAIGDGSEVASELKVTPLSEDTKVTIYLEKDEVAPATPNEDKDNGDNTTAGKDNNTTTDKNTSKVNYDNKVKAATTSKVTNNKSNADNLPQAGEKPTSVLAATGASLLALMAGAVYFRKRH